MGSKIPAAALRALVYTSTSWRTSLVWLCRIGWLVLLPFCPRLEGSPRYCGCGEIAPGSVSGQHLGATDLSLEDQFELAQQFAPILALHSLEKYFPCSPFFPLEGKTSGARSPTSIRDLLGTAGTRVRHYESLTLQERAERARVYYRAFPVKQGEGTAIILEYWFYYVQNVYRARGGVFPFWADTSHPNDLEYIRLVLLPKAQKTPAPGFLNHAYSLQMALASAHAETCPSNAYRFSGDQAPSNLQFLVELGSHAAALDADQDGRLTTGVDANSNYKLVWGIRDRGKTWAKYRPAYMDSRDGQNSIRFYCSRTTPFTPGRDEENGRARRTFSYQLVHVSVLEREFVQLQLDRRQVKEIFETQVAWPKRLAGKSNGNGEKLLIPPRQDDLSASRLIDDFRFTERGIKLGATTLISDYGLLLGGRYALLNKTKFFPDLILDCEAVFTVEGRDYYSTAVLGSYPVDAITKFFVGVGLVADSWKFERRQWDWMAGLEVKLGRLRVYNAFRKIGPLTHSGFDIRLYYLF